MKPDPIQELFETLREQIPLPNHTRARDRFLAEVDEISHQPVSKLTVVRLQEQHQYRGLRPMQKHFLLVATLIVLISLLSMPILIQSDDKPTAAWIQPTTTPSMVVPTYPPPNEAYRPKYNRGLDMSRIRQEYQTSGSNGSATLAMALSYLGSNISQARIRSIVSPNRDDVSASPIDLVNYVNENVEGIKALYRVNGTTDLLRKLINHDFPVIVEGGIYLAEVGWFGQYMMPVYIQTNQIMVLDSIRGDTSFHVLDFEGDWWQFNNIFIVVYESARETELMELLGDDYTTLAKSVERKLQASESSDSVSQGGQGWLNFGMDLTLIADYEAATAAFDKAFAAGDLPGRVTRYSHYQWLAYYAVGRYGDVVNQTGVALQMTPNIEEAHFYRALALAAQGQEDAESVLQEALALNPNFAPATQVLEWYISDELEPDQVIALLQAYYQGE